MVRLLAVHQENILTALQIHVNLAAQIFTVQEIQIFRSRVLWGKYRTQLKMTVITAQQGHTVQSQILVRRLVIAQKGITAQKVVMNRFHAHLGQIIQIIKAILKQPVRRVIRDLAVTVWLKQPLKLALRVTFVRLTKKASQIVESILALLEPTGPQLASRWNPNVLTVQKADGAQKEVQLL